MSRTSIMICVMTAFMLSFMAASAAPADFQRERNETIFGNVIWDLNQSFRIGFEVTYRETDNTSVLDNEGVGFHTQFRWGF